MFDSEKKKRKLWIRVYDMTCAAATVVLVLGQCEKNDSLFIGCQILGSLVHCND